MDRKNSSRKQWQFRETPMVVPKNIDHPLAHLSSEQLAESLIHTLAGVLAAIARRKFLSETSHGVAKNSTQLDRQVA